MTDGLPCVPGRLSSTLALIIYSLSTHFRIFGKKSAARPSPPSRAALRAAMSIFGEPFYRNWLVANSIYLTFLEREKNPNCIQKHTYTTSLLLKEVKATQSSTTLPTVQCAMRKARHGHWKHGLEKSDTGKLNMLLSIWWWLTMPMQVAALPQGRVGVYRDFTSLKVCLLWNFSHITPGRRSGQANDDNVLLKQQYLHF